MANAFDQFDAPAAAPAGNAFDQFDQPGYRGSVLPFSVDSAGNRQFDLSAGLPGAILDAVRLPGDVLNGTQPVMGPGGQPNPQALNRAINFGAMMTPTESGSRVPSAIDLKSAATRGYDAFRNSGLEFHGPAVADLLQGIKQNLETDGIIAEHAPKTFAAINKAVGDVAGAVGQPGTDSIATPANMQSVRRSFTNVSGDNTDMAAARRAKQAIDGFLGGPPAGAVLSAPPGGATAAARTFADANANFAAAQRSNDLTGTLDRANTGIAERAEARAEASHSGRNIDNAIRQRVASFLQSPENVAGFSQAEIDALNDVVKGGFIQNRLRSVANTLGGGSGLGQLIAGVSGVAGAHAMGPEGAGFGLALPAIGSAAKGMENSIARRALSPVDEMIRSRSPLYDQTQSALPPFTHSGAVIRALLPGLLQPQQPAQPATPGLLDFMARGGA